MNRDSRSASLASAWRLSVSSWATDACALKMARSLPARKRSSTGNGGKGAGAAAAAAALSAAGAWEDEAAGAGERAFRMSVPLVGLGVGAGDGQLLSATPSRRGTVVCGRGSADVVAARVVALPRRACSL